MGTQITPLYAALYKFDLSTKEWSVVSTKNEHINVSYHSLMAHNSVLFQFMGYNAHFDDETKIYMLDLKLLNPEWVKLQYQIKSKLSNQSPPNDSYSFDSDGSKAWFFGGYNGRNLRNDIFELDVCKGYSASSEMTFNVLTHNFILPSARKGHKMIALGKDLYIFGGENKSGL